MEYVSTNLRFLLWSNNIAREKWTEQIATWASCELSRADQLLRTGALRPSEQISIAQAVGVLEEDLLLTSLLEVRGIDILLENLQYLIETLKRIKQKQKELAEQVNVDPTTISRWYSGKLRPTKKHLEAICRSFGLPPHTDLESEPLFLSLSPITAATRRQWLHDRIKVLDVEALQGLFPALERLLEAR